MEGQQKVLFIVYRTEWWGCFDSLCRQECSRDNTVCYVMPIPRYDRDKKSGEIDFTRRHFSIETLIKEIPRGTVLLDYEKFSWEQEFQKIYIHNPYDETSPFDSVDEEYYSQSLKKIAKSLIYVPHLLYMENIPEIFVQCPVYKFVDAILLCDERVRYSLDISYDEKIKIVPSGIVEYLEQLNAKKNRENIDTRKKLLYCVSFNDLYCGAKQQIKKMWDIFTYMETRKDIVLVFRPDEDIPFRYSELPKAIREEYEEVQLYFINRKIGIYSEEANPYLTVMEADGIMSVDHSLNAMFSIQGKYVISLRYEVCPFASEEDMCIPYIRAMTVEEKIGELELWFVPIYSRLLCRVVVPEGLVEVVSEIPEEILGWCNFIDIQKVEDYIFLAPFVSNGIWKYDLKQNRYIKQYLLGDVEGYMSKIIYYGEYLYFIPRQYPGIVKYCMKTEEIQLLDGWIAELDSHVPVQRKREPYFIRAIKQEGNMLYMASSKCDVWMEMNLDTEEWKIEKMELQGNGFVDMVKDGENVWLLPYQKADIVKWNCVTKESKILYKAKQLDGLNSPFAFAVDSEDKIIVFPELEDDVLAIKKGQEGNVERIKDRIPCGENAYISEFLKRGREMKQKAGYQFVRKLSNGMILVYEYYDGSFLIMDNNLHIVEKIPCRLPMEVVRKQWEIVCKKSICRNGFTGVLQEGEALSIIIDFFAGQEESVVKEIKQNYLKELIVDV